jgi:hypothetical protein
MAQYEYRVFTSRDIEGTGFFGTNRVEGLQQKLNELGQKGWRLVGLEVDDEGMEDAVHFIAVMMREKWKDRPPPGRESS